MDTKLKADIAESAVITELLSRGHKVLRPVGDRLPYDLAVDDDGQLIRIQVKSAWFDSKKKLHLVDVRRTKTNRRKMLRKKYCAQDFDLAAVFLQDLRVFYVFPAEIFNSYASSLAIVEGPSRQRPPKSAVFRERWDLISPKILNISVCP